jgi:pimeloyl-ACP methyl ester carboxylesterase
MPHSQPVDGFRLAHDRGGAGPPVVLLHGWPGDRQDYRAVVPLLHDRAELISPDLRGFGESDKPPEAPADAFAADAQARSVPGLLDELGIETAVRARATSRGRRTSIASRTATRRRARSSRPSTGTAAARA